MEENYLNSIKTIELNYNTLLCDTTRKKSFIWKLHELQVFDIRLFKKLINAIIYIIKYRDSHKLDVQDKVIKKIVFINIYVLKAIKCHFDPNDYLSIKNITKNHYIYTARLEFLLRVLLEKTYQSILDYEDELGKLVEDSENE